MVNVCLSYSLVWLGTRRLVPAPVNLLPGTERRKSKKQLKRKPTFSVERSGQESVEAASPEAAGLSAP